jgi:NAD(P)-dependent dehydrogenase (short-subunit alcohol dehydrogenase family)
MTQGVPVFTHSNGGDPVKTVLITGANRGIGWQTGRELSGKGYRVFFGTRKAKANGSSVDEIDGEAFWITIDVSRSASIREAAQWLGQRGSVLDVLVNNAGIFPDAAFSITDIPREQLVATFQTNTFGPIEVTQAFLPLLRRSEGARVINVSSGYGKRSGLSADVPSYCLSKLALNGVTLMLADKLRPDGIAVNSVDPGWVRTDMGGRNARRSVEEAAAGIVRLGVEAPQEWTGKFLHYGREVEW